MSAIRHDSFSRGKSGGIRVVRVPRQAPRALGLIVSCLLAIGLLALSKVEHPWLSSLRAEATAALEPALALVRLPVEGARVLARTPSGDSELLRQVAELKRENRELKQWRSRAEDLESQVVELRRIAEGVPDRQTGIVTGRVFVEGQSDFTRSAVIDIGASHGVKTGFAAINGDGLVGTVIETGPRSARLLLVTDRRSRIPVFVGEERLRGILSGNGSGAPVLDLIMATAKLENGALITTSGEDGMLPRGVPIGFIELKSGQRGVRLNAALDQLDFVSILLFEPPGSDLAQGELPVGQ